MSFLIKTLVSALIIAAIAEISKRSTVLGALLASLPLISLTAMFLIYFDTKDVERISKLSLEIFWLVLPTLPFFLLLPFMLSKGINFYLSMLIGIFITIGCYSLTIKMLGLKI